MAGSGVARRLEHQQRRAFPATNVRNAAQNGGLRPLAASISAVIKSCELQSIVIPAKAGIQSIQRHSMLVVTGRSVFGLGPSLRWDDERNA